MSESQPVRSAFGHHPHRRAIATGPLAQMACLFIFVMCLMTMRSGAVTVTTTNGVGADRGVNECNYTIGGSTNTLDGASGGADTEINARWVNVSPFTNHINEVIALRFDLAGHLLPACTNFQIALINQRTNPARILHYYGVSNGVSGANNNGTITNWTDDDWSESSSVLKFSTLPGVHFDGSSATKGFSNTVDLGSATMNAFNEGTSATFSSAALDAFIQGHPNNVVTILVGVDTSSTGQSRFTSKETTATATSLFTGGPGDFAPRLNFTVNAAPDVAGLYFQQQPTDANVGVALSPAVTVIATNSSGLPVSNAVISITLASGSGFLNGTLSQFTDGTGTATFANLSLSAAGAKQLQAAASTNTALGATFKITGIPPVVTALSPTNNAAGRCVDTLLQMTFDKPVRLQKTGSVRIYNAAAPAVPVDTLNLTLNVDAGPITNVQSRTIGGETFTNYPVIVSGSTATVFPHLGVLAANTTYYVLMDSGVFTDTNGIPFPGISTTNVWRFTTKATGPANTTNLVVAADNSADFCTVQGAVDFISSGNTTPRLINIRNGTYTEIVNVNNRHNLTFRGQNRSNTIVGYANNAPMNSSTHYRMAFKVNANDIAFDTLTLTNMTPKGGGQAETLMVETDRKRCVIWNANVCSYQDTILMNTSGTQCYFQDSLIQGDTDFIWGGGNAFFTNCEIKSLFGGHITQSRTAAISNGMSFVKCRLTKVGAISATLGRNLGNLDGNVAFIHCLIDSHITGWNDANMRYWEFGNSNLAATAAITYNGTQLGAGSVELTNARSAILWLNGWSPSLLPTIISHPTNQSLLAGQIAVFNVSATGIPSPTYQWRKNGTNIANATNATYSIPGALPADAGTYSVLATTPAGSATSSNATLTVIPQVVLAFPGAEGAGRFVTGGRGTTSTPTTVFEVTNLLDSNTAGTLRYACSQSATYRTIVFRVSGTIHLNSALNIPGNTTIAGQTAPGDGICLADYWVNINGNNVIIRYLRFRMGDKNQLILDPSVTDTNCWPIWPPFTPTCKPYGDVSGSYDSLGATDKNGLMVDHCSVSWCNDEALSLKNCPNTTVQWTIISEPLDYSYHYEGTEADYQEHGYGGIFGATNASFHHNVFAHCKSRTPRFHDTPAGGAKIRVDMRNNVIYNWRINTAYGGIDGEFNIVSNYYKAGPDTTTDRRIVGTEATARYYLKGNKMVGLDGENGTLSYQVTTNNWYGTSSGAGSEETLSMATPTLTNVALTTQHTADQTYAIVLAQAGASIPKRDAVDTRIVNEVKTKTGKIIDVQGGYDHGTPYSISSNAWPVLLSTTAPTDTDHDGMPDYWETAVGLNPSLASDRSQTNSVTGYTRLEEYLNWRAEAHALCDRNGTVDVNLRTATGGATNLTYVVANGTNGTVSLLGDGYTARFTASPNTNGIAGFTFTATDPMTATSFGPVNYGILITTNNAVVSNTPPTLAAISNYTRIAGATLTFTNSASDSDVPAQTLTFALLGNPGGATLTTNTGVFNWRPTQAQGGSSNGLKVVVTDSGSPVLSATQSFSVVVSVPAQPVLQPVLTNGPFSLSVSGDGGPDYAVQASTNLIQWENVFTTNSPALPFWWTDTNSGSFPRRFYRLLLGP